VISTININYNYYMLGVICFVCHSFQLGLKDGRNRIPKSQNFSSTSSNGRLWIGSFDVELSIVGSSRSIRTLNDFLPQRS